MSLLTTRTLSLQVPGPGGDGSVEAHLVAVAGLLPRPRRHQRPAGTGERLLVSHYIYINPVDTDY